MCHWTEVVHRVLSGGKSVPWSSLENPVHICHSDSYVQYEWKWENKYFTSRRHAGATWRGLLPVCEQCHGKGIWPQLQTTQPQSHALLCHSPMLQNPVGKWEKDNESYKCIFCRVSLIILCNTSMLFSATISTFNSYFSSFFHLTSPSFHIRFIHV